MDPAYTLGVKWIAAVPLSALAVAGCSGGDGDRSPQAQTSSQAPASPRVDTPYQTSPRALMSPYELEPPLAPRHYVRRALSQPLWRLIDAKVVGQTVRYVLQSDYPRRSLSYEMTSFLYDFGFGEGGRPMGVRLPDGDGRFAWAARYGGVGKTWVRARLDLAHCGPILDSRRRTLPPATGAGDAPPCPLEASPATVLR